MPDYRAYVVDDEGHIKTFVIVTALDDAAAVEATKLLADGHDMELWSPWTSTLPFCVLRQIGEPMETYDSYSALKQKLDQATRLMDAADDPMTKDRLREMVRELDRMVEIAAARDNLDDAG